MNDTLFTYKITLSPIDWFFFGGETTFGERGNHANYFAKSNLFPQESGIIGMLRYEILKKDNLLEKAKKEKVEAAIGKEGFNPSCSDDINMGALNAVSPVMLEYKGEVYSCTPLDQGKEINFSENTSVYINEEKIFLPELVKKEEEKAKANEKEDYSVKKWFSIETGKIISLKDDDIFYHKTKIGITKNTDEREENNKEGYFKGVYHKLKSDFKFVFFAKLTCDFVGSYLVSLGAERSMFYMNVTNGEEYLKNPSAAQQIPECNNNPWNDLWSKYELDSPKILFLSEAFVSNEVYDYCKFAWTDTVPFRCITRKWRENGNYASLNRKTERSSRYNLLRRGSVLFLKNDLSEVEKESLLDLITNPYLQRFGYNQFKINLQK